MSEPLHKRQITKAEATRLMRLIDIGNDESEVMDNRIAAMIEAAHIIYGDPPGGYHWAFGDVGPDGKGH